jgi:hypothetical protein
MIESARSLLTDHHHGGEQKRPMLRPGEPWHPGRRNPATRHAPSTQHAPFSALRHKALGLVQFVPWPEECAAV